ncbi:MAG: dTDP-4-dehydrorhamnose reductase [Henriciella sp.]
MRAAKLLCIGKSGQVARALKERHAAYDLELTAMGRPEVDLADPDSLKRAIELASPDLVVNAAAYTAVDQAETEKEAAFAINAEGVGTLAALCAANDVPLIHISTDYVFDGEGSAPFLETGTPAPINVYGASKLEGEVRLRDTHAAHIILRTSWVYSPYGGNFVKTMLRLAQEKGSASVVDDQIGCPTSAHEIAEAILAISQRIFEDPSPDLFGTYHFSAAGEASWADVAAFIFELYEARTGCKIGLNRIPSSDYPTPAARPRNSRLDTRKITDTFGIRPQPWRDGVRETVNRLMDEGR